MRLVSRHILRALAAPFVWGLVALTGLLLLQQLAMLIDKFGGRGLPPMVMVEAFVLTLPALLALSLPMAVLVASLYGFSQLAGDLELVAIGGGFSHVTANPVLVVGNYWDPATNYAGAVAAARLLPNSRLLSSNSWGHTAYGTSECVTRAVGRYLVSVTLPDRGTRCVGNEQPFTRPLDTSGRHRPEPTRPLPPVVPPFPGSVPRS